MIHIQTRRVGPLVIAMTVNDNRDIYVAIGLTAEHATQRLIRGLR